MQQIAEIRGRAVCRRDGEQHYRARLPSALANCASRVRLAPAFKDRDLARPPSTRCYDPDFDRLDTRSSTTEVRIQPAQELPAPSFQGPLHGVFHWQLVQIHMPSPSNHGELDPYCALRHIGGRLRVTHSKGARQAGTTETAMYLLAAKR